MGHREARNNRFSVLDIPDAAVCQGRAENGPSGGLWPRGRREKGRRRALAGYRREERVWLGQAASSVGCLVWLAAVAGAQGDFGVQLIRGKPAPLLQHGGS